MKSQILEEVRQPTATGPLRPLIVEDSAEDKELILAELQAAGYQVSPTLVENRSQFQDALAGDADFDVVLSDYRLPAWNGLDALLELKALRKDIPFLMITGTLGEEAAVECIKQGVSDYVLKDRLSRLPVVLKRALHEKALRREAEHEITQRKLAEDALRLSEARNRDLVENSVYGICRVSADGAFLDANPSLMRILGCNTPGDLKALNVGRDVFRFPEQHARLLADCHKNGQVHGAEAEWRRRDGGIVTMRLHLRQLCTPGTLDSLEIVAEDVTELRAMERQLRGAQKFEAIGQLAGGVAHDFNNVIGAILGWAEMGLEQCRDNTPVAERFARIREQAERAAALTRQLLAFARRQVLQPRAIDLNTVISGLMSFLEKVIGKDVELQFREAPLHAVTADPTQIEQVVMNLCINARDAMPEGGRLLVETSMVDLDEDYCRFYPYMTPGSYAVLSVSDTGIGMDNETRERIFEPFFTTKDRGKGTGLGLATVYGIVKQHGGFIHVYSEPSHGSMFRAYLPAKGGAAAQTREKIPVASLASMHGTETILIAEDHESIREMARQALAGLGYRVLAAGDGEEALRLCEQETPRLAILDLVMPKLSGSVTAAKLTAQYAGMRVLFTSGYSSSPECLTAENHGRRYLQKPYSPTTLARMVREILDEK